MKSAEQHKIQELAYLLWQEAGSPDGRDWEFWLQAETQVQTVKPKAAAKPRAAKPKAAAAPAKAKAAPKPKAAVAAKPKAAPKAKAAAAKV